jgi:3-carboxy-cis,cis-muconate cycloisomerase
MSSAMRAIPPCEGIGLAEALIRDTEVTAHLGADDLKRLTDSAGYLGSANAFIDRVLARAACDGG